MNEVNIMIEKFKKIRNIIMKSDIIELFCGQTIQHGKSNNRIYLMKFNPSVDENIPQELINKARKDGYSKIFAKSTKDTLATFLQYGFIVEAFIPAYFNGKDDLFMVCYYTEANRYHEEEDRKSVV